MVLTEDQVSVILKTNPNKALIQNARNYSKKLCLHVLGRDVADAMNRNEYFENPDIFAVRSKDPTSNKDLFARLLQREEMVFTAKGGASFYTGLNDAQTAKMDATLDKIRFNTTIRKWIKEFALQAYRVDPMAVLFIEVDAKNNAYPTYKSIDSVFDYLPNGRNLEYIIFRLKPNEAKSFLAQAKQDIPEDLAGNTNLNPDSYSNYFRVIDDQSDRIFKGGSIPSLIDEAQLQFENVPAVIASDIIDFTNPLNFLSPLNKTIELADSFLQDRSIRDLSKKYSGFPKGYEPLMQCTVCLGTGMLSGKSCPECTAVGADRGTGYKLRTKVQDIARFPLPKTNENGYDPSKFYGYITPSIETWDKQDTSLNDIEAQINDTYWGTTDRQSTTGPTKGKEHSFKETATKTLADLQPIYARLNHTADWAESTENALCDFIGYHLFGETFKESVRTYGRYYILETPDELMEEYLDAQQKGAPQSVLFDVLRKYYHAVFQNDPIQLAIKLKLVNVEPFVHISVTKIEAADIARIDYLSKVYFSEWLAAQDDNYLLRTKTEDLILNLQEYVTKKITLQPELAKQPTVTITDTIKNTN